MKRLAVILIAAVLLLTGCVDNPSTDEKINGSEEGNNTNVSVDNNTDIDVGNDSANIENINMSTDADIGTNGGDEDNTGIDSTGKGSDWCVVGGTVNEGGKQLTIKGLTTREGREVCQAEAINGNEKTIFYFSQDGKYKSMSATSSSGSGSASANANIEVGTNNN